MVARVAKGIECALKNLRFFVGCWISATMRKRLEDWFEWSRVRKKREKEIERKSLMFPVSYAFVCTNGLRIC